MTIVTEDGTGLSYSETYASVSETDTYMSDRAMTLWAALSTTQKEQALRRATDYMIQKYRSRWSGGRNSTTQALDWPRVGVVIKGYKDASISTGMLVNGFANSIASGYYQVPSDIVPKEVKNACMELALRASAGSLSEDQEQKVVQETVGPLTVKYDQFSSSVIQFKQVDGWLSPYLRSTSSGANMKLGRC